MSELRLDYQPNSPFPGAGVALLGVAVIALILAGDYYLKLNAQVVNWEARVRQIQDGGKQGLAGKPFGLAGGELVQAVDSANSVLRQLTVPWEDLFQAVELSGDNKVTLLALEPDIENRQVKISGETRNYKALLNYISRLQEQPVFGTVYLQSHQVQMLDRDKPVRFSLYATWREKP